MDLGLRFIVEPSGVDLSVEEAAALRDLRPAGIMLRRRNFKQGEPYDVWLSSYAKLMEDVRNAIGRPSIIVCVDHEGGNVHRFPAPVTRFPYPAAYAANDEAIREVASMMAEELRALGVNVSFSPVADIHSNPANPVINERAFGTTAADVARRVVVCAEALRSGGIVPCGKHFPGHGDTSVDSHYDLPVLDYTEQQLAQRELVPFCALIQSGMEMIMSGHLMVPRIDPNNPATLSSVVMRELLRNRLGFTGVTIADALGMKAIHKDVQHEMFAERAHNAGIDLFLMVGDTVSISDAVAVRNEFVAAQAASRIDELSLHSVQARLTHFLDALPQYPVHEINAGALSRHAALASELSQHAPWSQFQFNPVGFE